MSEQSKNNSNFVHAYIMNFSLPDQISDLNEDLTNIEGLLEDCEEHRTEWSVPRDGHRGDILMFLFSKKAKLNLNKMRREYEDANKGFAPGYSAVPPRPVRGRRAAVRMKYSPTNYSRGSQVKSRLDTISDLYDKYGACVCAIGRMASNAAYDPDFKYKHIAPVTDLYLLNKPLNESRFLPFLQLRQGGTTPVWGEHFETIKEMILQDNPDFPEYLADSYAMSEEQAQINSKNWLEKNLEVHRHYPVEEEFRAFYVDRLLHELSDDGTFYTECACFRDGVSHPSYADYVIPFNGKWVPVETKISIDIEPDLNGQVRKYCNLQQLNLNKETTAVIDDVINDRVIVIDEERIELYSSETNSRQPIARLDDIQTTRDIRKLKETLSNNM